MLDLKIRIIKEYVLNGMLVIIPDFVTPNQLTVTAFVFGLISTYFCAHAVTHKKQGLTIPRVRISSETSQ